MFNLNERVICNSCDYCMDVDELRSYEEPENNWKGAKCPICGVADDYTDITQEWAVDQLKIFAQYFGAWRGPAGVNTKEALTWSKRLSEIADIIEAEIE